MLENIFPSKEEKKKLDRKVRKGLRLVVCPNCGRRIVYKWAEEVIADAKCGYRKLPTRINEEK